jgi:nucleoside-diphosphate-sugar epimerase
MSTTDEMRAAATGARATVRAMRPSPSSSRGAGRRGAITTACAEASRILVDAALAAGVAAYVQPTVTFVYPGEGAVSEDTPIAEAPVILRSALSAERETDRFAQSGQRGVVLRLGLLDGPGTGHDAPIRAPGATLHVADAARALIAALTLPSGVYKVCRDGERISNHRFTHAAGWHQTR